MASCIQPVSEGSNKRPLLATLSHPWVAEFGASILSLEDGKCEIASVQYLRAAYLK